ncbi:MAG: 50S ribosomal protein L2 [Candidatus Spechtbacterales bacterium]|nr:50S ribosomal protein L2 [Candidatus Spechtbacterales bacterium]
MGVKRHKPTTPGRRGMITTDYGELTKKEPEKSLTRSLHRKKGRSHGKISTRHKGGGSKRLYRDIDFKQDQVGDTLTIKALEYDPNRTAFIALVQNQEGVKRYILAYDKAKVGDELKIAEKAPIKPGNRMKIKNIPVGTLVHNIEIKPGRGGQMARSAGSYAKVMAHDEGHTQLTMPSTEVRVVSSNGFATIGTVSHSSHREEVVGKAGKNRRRGKRPHVRGSAMNPVDHPHGGGEGRAPVGLKYPKTPWGKNAYGVKTRKPNKYSDRYIIKRRKKKKRKK